MGKTKKIADSWDVTPGSLGWSMPTLRRHLVTPPLISRGEVYR